MTYDLLKTGEVLTLLGISRSTLDLWVAKGQFPKPRKLGNKLNVWSASDVEAWLSNVNSSGSNSGGAV